MKDMLTMDIGLLRRIVSHDPETGKLTWLTRTPDMFEDGAQTAEHKCNSWNSRYAGTAALDTTHRAGYRYGRIMGRNFLAHRVIWALEHGEWPEVILDHHSGATAANRIINLRLSNHQHNARNAKMDCRNTSGATGVYWHKRDCKWCGQIRVDGRTIHLGYFDNFDAAVAARRAAEAEHGYDPNHGIPAEWRELLA